MKLDWKPLLVIGVLVFVAVVCDIAISQSTGWFASTFRFTYVLAMVLVIWRSLAEATAWALVMGLLLDVFSSTLFGITMLILLLVVHGVHIVRETVLKQYSVAVWGILSVGVVTGFVLLGGASHALLRWQGIIEINAFGSFSFLGYILAIILTTVLLSFAVRMLALAPRIIII